MKPTQAAPRPRPEPLARQHHPDDARRRHPQRYIDELSVTGLTSNPTIFDKAISGGDAYDEQIAELREQGLEPRGALLRAGARPTCAGRPTCSSRVHERTDGVDGWVSLEVSPLLAYDTEATIAAGGRPARPGRADNLFIKIPGTAGGPARDRGVDLRRDPDQRHPAVLDRAVPGGRRRLHEAGSSAGSRPGSTRTCPRSPRSSSAAGTSPSPTRCRTSSRTQLGIAVGKRDLRRLPRAARLRPLAGGSPSEGARPQRLLCARAPGPRTPRPRTPSTSRPSRRRTRSTRCPRRRCSPSPTTARSASRCRPTAATPRRCSPRFAEAGVDVDALAARLQQEGAEAFVKSWDELLGDDRVRATPPRSWRGVARQRDPLSTAAARARRPGRRSRSTTPRSATATCASSSPRTPTAASG